PIIETSLSLSARQCRRRSLLFRTAPAPAEIYSLSLHDALPISRQVRYGCRSSTSCGLTSSALCITTPPKRSRASYRSRVNSVCPDRKSTRLNSSHSQISYAVFCLKKKTHLPRHPPRRRVTQGPE